MAKNIIDDDVRRYNITHYTPYPSNFLNSKIRNKALRQSF